MRRTLALGLFLTAVCLVLAMLTLTTTGCALHVVNPKYSIHEIRPHVDIAIPLSSSSIDFDFLVGIDNPNSIALRLDRVEFDLLVNDQTLLSTVSRQGVTVPAHAYGEVHLVSRVAYANIRPLFDQIARAVRGQGVHYQIRGYAYYGTPFGSLRLPIHVDGVR